MKYSVFILLILAFILSLFFEVKTNANIADLKSNKSDIINLINKKQYNTALTLVNKQLKSYPKDNELYNLHGIINNKTKNYQQSVNDFKKAISLSINSRVLASSNNSYYVNLCESYIYLKDYETAKSNLRKALARNPDLDIYHARVTSCDAASEYKFFPDEDSYKKCLKAVQEYFKSDNNLNNKELTYSWLGEFCSLFRVGNEQLNFFDIAIKINPQDYHNYFYRAKYFIIHEQFNKAKQDLEMALKIHKNDPDIIMTFGVMNYLSKNYMESLKYCKIIIDEQYQKYLCKALLISCFDYNAMPLYKFIFGHYKINKYINQFNIPEFNKLILKIAIGDLDITNKQLREKYSKELYMMDSWNSDINLSNYWFSSLTYLGLAYDNPNLREYFGSYEFQLCGRLGVTLIYSNFEDPTYLILIAFFKTQIFDRY